VTNTPTTLADWLDYIERQHPATIDMGLERVRAVAAAMGLGTPAQRTIVVGGTNGKGSTVAFIEAIGRAAGWKVGAYTSPHLLRYNERVRIDGQDVDDAALVAAFNAIEAARGEITLTYSSTARWLRCSCSPTPGWTWRCWKWAWAGVSMQSTSSMPTWR